MRCSTLKSIYQRGGTSPYLIVDKTTKINSVTLGLARHGQQHLSQDT